MAPDHIFEIFIKTTPERLWQALTDGDITQQYYFGSRVESDWKAGSPYHFPFPGGGVDGTVLEADPPRKLVTTFRASFAPGLSDLPESTVTWEIRPAGDSCKLTLIHSGIESEPKTAGILEGWVKIISGLKTVLETGQPLPIG